jgi:hypothetical protein
MKTEWYVFNALVCPLSHMMMKVTIILYESQTI